jgi:hippurate hydrolase
MARVWHWIWEFFMGIKPEITELHEELTAWRRELHTHPELAFEEHRTSEFVAKKLSEFGLEVHRGLAHTGVVGVLKSGNGDGPRIGLRADMDALPIEEQTNLPHSSKIEGKMHACGHDGHTTMLLGAAKHLAAHPNFSGTVYFIFQPGEESAGGGELMVKEGLFEKFPMETVYGMHNWPGLPVGEIAVASGPVMAASDTFWIKITGKGGHAAMPHQGVDTVVVSAHIVTALQTISSRTIDPADPVVVSVTQIHGGDATNIIPEEVTLAGTARTFSKQARDMVEPAMRRIVNGICTTFGASAEFNFERGYPATVNSAAETGIAAEAAGRLLGGEHVHNDRKPSMGSEDFAYMLEKKPGSYIWVGAGEDRAQLHNPHYDFNDEILPIGVGYWATLVEDQLPKQP